MGKPGRGSEHRTFRNIYSVGADERVQWEWCWVKTRMTAVIVSLCPGSCIGSIWLIDLSPARVFAACGQGCSSISVSSKAKRPVRSLEAQGLGGQSGRRRAASAFTLIQSESDQIPTPTVCCRRGTLKAK